jgi:hypothetical protein
VGDDLSVDRTDAQAVDTHGTASNDVLHRIDDQMQEGLQLLSDTPFGLDPMCDHFHGLRRAAEPHLQVRQPGDDIGRLSLQDGA